MQDNELQQPDNELLSLKTELESIRSEHESVRVENERLKLDYKKRDLIDSAIASMDTEFTIDSDSIRKIRKVISQLPDSDDLEATVQNMCDVAKRPVVKEKFPTTLGSGINPSEPPPRPRAIPKNSLINFYRKK